MMNNKERGALGEEIAAEYLRSIGYEILDRNFSVRGGEMDIIALDGDVVVFVEVKTRIGNEPPGTDVMDTGKYDRMTKCIELYSLVKKDTIGDRRVRYDYMEIRFRDGMGKAPEILHGKNSYV